MNPHPCLLTDEQVSEFGVHVGGSIYHFEERETGHKYSLFEFTVRTTQMSSAVDYLRRNGGDPSWIIFCLHNPEVISANVFDQLINLQFAKVGGVVGLEWVLLLDRNVADRKSVVEYAERHGYKLELRKLNEVQFLRVETGDLPWLGKHILEDLYGVTPDTSLGLLLGKLTMSSDWPSHN